MFKNSFKYYKSRSPLPDLKDVIDLNNPDCNRVIGFKGHLVNEPCKNELGLRSLNTWKIYEFIDIPGLILIKNPFTADGQKFWIIKCLKHYTRKPNKLNLDVHDVLDNDEAWWDKCFGKSEQGKDILPKLRWATLGYHHNWDTKLYSEKSKTEMPKELSALTLYLAKVLGFSTFNAEAAIINYYRMNSTLAGHTDHSEVNVKAPLFSISFGQTAIFLIGGLSPCNAAHAVFLQSGDVVVMSGESRLRYHGIPKILPALTTPWEDDSSDVKRNSTLNQNDWFKAKCYISKARINMNVRQVLRPGQMTLF